ncbi:hypothetical protein A2962_05170 [Candidatus Woesebacteria bacterium RIFCSPLOWO2_01_FULL_39_61]|uniref:NHL/RHS/YD repeat protein n=2 Tax=Candidatus Woeseibacteriota TaxID=1752722 RepID=A0A0G0QMY2_9BACT|nr:MAG: NHL/RHS/YD repeat protein [Candidatus Woesebacteria bacterium GW2011_GWA1_39_21b]OGM33426.1 MAG: hypothetical protein A3D01_04770 [Candidatus Woesebacteria bacterium RIFCSPHIGHO2_02_FULL_39_13]OGM38365.1 MAG: hypothetical protein A3E13_04165 [Candidatus Woesebacteria bacterium RIFCSPHIGHO2_12_FULL_40_20]OGM65684.1 MAG: hypothetical protein A2962_05170 [Candidatus Woesebacteria bacterium RIFCSPLOWO2_01_FULL_39_61]
MPKSSKLLLFSTCLIFLLGSVYQYLIANIYPVYAQASSNTANFLYDGGGQRIYKGVNEGIHTYYISSGIEVEISPQGSVTYRKNYYFSGKLVAVKDNSQGSERVNYTHQDHLGSTTLVTSQQGTVVSEQVYYPYGSTRTVSGTLPTERAYTGQISDQDLTGLYYYNARYYNPTIAKFTQADPAQNTLNRYFYVSNNPINLIDPTGNQGCELNDYFCLMSEGVMIGPPIPGFDSVPGLEGYEPEDNNTISAPTEMADSTDSFDWKEVDWNHIYSRFASMANNWYSGAGNPRLNKFNQVVRNSISRGVDPIFMLTLWLHESAASDYLGTCLVLGDGNPESGYCSQIQDLGFNDPAVMTRVNTQGIVLEDFFDEQLKYTLNLPERYSSACGVSGYDSPMQMFTAKYAYGNCTVTHDSNQYLKKLKKWYYEIAPYDVFGIEFPDYPIDIKLPLDGDDFPPRRTPK